MSDLIEFLHRSCNVGELIWLWVFPDSLRNKCEDYYKQASGDFNF